MVEERKTKGLVDSGTVAGLSLTYGGISRPAMLNAGAHDLGNSNVD